MVKKVYGIVNGHKISFKHIRGDLWQAEVPINQKGEWICELYAEDMVGNTTSIGKRLLAIDGHEASISLVPRSYTIDSGEKR